MVQRGQRAAKPPACRVRSRIAPADAAASTTGRAHGGGPAGVTGRLSRSGPGGVQSCFSMFHSTMVGVRNTPDSLLLNADGIAYRPTGTKGATSISRAW